MLAPRTLTAPRRGFTLVESLFALSFLAILFLAVAHTSSRASDAFDEGSEEQALSTEALRCLDRAGLALELAQRESLAPEPAAPLGQSQLSFRTPVGFAGGVVQWGPTQRIAFEQDPLDADDGQDNDGDGRVDEGQVVWIENPGVAGERRMVWARDVADLLDGEIENDADDNGNGLVDERGLSFVAVGDVVTIRLTCERLDEGRRALRKTVTTAVRLRN